MTRAGHHTMMHGSAPMRCAVFDGTISSRIQSSPTTFSPVSMPSVSVMAWIWYRSLSDITTTTINWFDNASNKKTGPQFGPYATGTGSFRIIFQYVKDFGTIEIGDKSGAWHHYAFTFGSGSLKVYFDGNLIKTDTASSWLRDNSSASLVFAIPAYAPATGTITTCKVANVNIFDKVVSAADMTTLASKPSVISTSALHQYLFANDDGEDTGVAATKMPLTIGATTAFEKLSTGI